MATQASRLIPKNVFVSQNIDSQVDLIELKLPSTLRIQAQQFDPETYEVEDPIVYTNDVSTILPLLKSFYN